jgi:Fur family zinc uptake transcriptional regulator
MTILSGLNATLLHLAACFGIISLMIQDSIRILQAQGYKMTKPRRLVLEILEETQQPLSPYDIQRTLKKQDKYLNHVTIYRILDLFCRLNLVHKLPSSGGFVKCSLGKKEGCHRFMVCRQCGAIQEFADEGLCHEESKFAQNLDFHTEYHLSETYGLCSNCYRLKGKTGTSS